jgi:hypothetical protein
MKKTSVESKPKVIYRVKDENPMTKAESSALQRLARHVQLGLPLTAKDLTATMDKHQLAELVILMLKDKLIELDVLNTENTDYEETT